MRLAPMLRSVDLLLLLALVGVVIWTFKVKNDSSEALERVSQLERQIAAEKTEIDLLQSDWSLLTNPARLQKLSERFAAELELSPIEAGQMATDDQLPPVRAPETNKREEDFADIDSDTKTGSVKSIQNLIDGAAE